MIDRPHTSKPVHAKARTRNYLLLIGILFAAGTALSLYRDIRQARDDRYRLAVSTANVLFSSVVATRNWNATHGGVYVPVTETMLPNPYLTVEDRDVKTTSGVWLTKVNPAYMTRLIGEHLEGSGAVVHLTSLKVLRPENAPDEWERAALERFEKGGAPEHSLTGSPPDRIFRYMEPLATESSCLGCHEDQGYRLGDIRGGIGIAFPYAPYERSIGDATRHAIVSHLSFFAVALAVLLFLGRRILELVENMEEAQRKIRTLEGILPMCSHCKKVRREGSDPWDPAGWVPVDSYITDRSEASVSHGICPECMERHYGPGGEFGGR